MIIDMIRMVGFSGFLLSASAACSSIAAEFATAGDMKTAAMWDHRADILEALVSRL